MAGIVAVGLRQAGTHIVARDTGADLPRTQLESLVCLADLCTVSCRWVDAELEDGWGDYDVAVM